MALEIKFQWKMPAKVYKSEKIMLAKIITTDHPLKMIGKFVNREITRSKSASVLQCKNQIFDDPLSAILEGSDPLQVFSDISQSPLSNVNIKDATHIKGLKSKDNGSCLELNPNFISWENFCSELSRFSTKQHLTLASSFLSLPRPDAGSKVAMSVPDKPKLTGQTGTERVKTRLEQLDSLEVGGSGGIREMGGLTQEQFSNHLLALKQEMKEAWVEDQRVNALKIAIQCVKSLALSAPEVFYPRKFALIADLLDLLGSLVHARLQQLVSSPQNYLLTSPKAEAEETARNWFYKVTSIRELLPRVYLEAVLLPCYSILPFEEGKDSLKRLTLMCRGIGDPLVASYIRCYIVHVGLKHQPKYLDHVMIAIEDNIVTCKWGWQGAGVEEIDVLKEGFERGSIVADKVFYPAFRWLLQALPKTQNNFESIMKALGEWKGVPQFVVVKVILKTFPPPVVSAHCLSLMQVLDNCFAFGEDPQDPLQDLAAAMNEVPPSGDQKLDVLNAAWSLVVRIRSMENYLKAATAWLRFTGLNFTTNEMDKVLSDVFKRLTKATLTNSQSVYIPLLDLLTTALSSNPRSEELYTFSSFRGLLSVFQRESGSGMALSHVTEMKRLLDAAIDNHKRDFTEPEVVQLLLSLFASLHDGINALTTQDERRQISNLVNTFVRKVNFGNDFELQLDFYVDARASFSNLDSVLEALIQHVFRLQMTTLRIVKGHHTGKTAAFERACTAYCFITIPSITCPLVKLKLYLLCGSVAMVNNCMGQGDACIKSAIKVVLDIASNLSSSPSSSLLEGIPSAIANVASYLVALPDPPDATRPFYLFWGLVNSLRSLVGLVDAGCFCRLNLVVLKGVCASAQDDLPYHLRNVDGNDRLYGGAEDFKTETGNISSEIFANILSSFKEACATSDGISLDLASELIETILIYGDISDAKLRSLVTNLFSLVRRHPEHGRLKKQLEIRIQRRLNQAT